MRLTLEDILKRIGGYVDQDASTPTGTDLTVRINYVNRGLTEWSQSYDWEALTSKHNFTASYISTQTLALPANFRKPMGALYYYRAGYNPPEEYQLIPRDEAYSYSSNENLAYVDGNVADGWNLIVPKGLPSGASLLMNIQTRPSSMVTLNDVAAIPDPEYLVDIGIAYVLESRSDPRFPLVKADADRKLKNMIEDQNAKNKGILNRVPRRTGFVIGRS